MKLPIYLDYQATTPVDPRVLDEMLPCFKEDFGNASSRSHAYGWKAEEKVEKARHQVAELIHSQDAEIIFTSGATESNNLALKGVAHRYQERGRHIITCVTEHKAVLDPCRSLEREGFEVTYLRVNEQGHIDLDELKKGIRSDTLMISLMAANNEIGVLHPIQEIGRFAKGKGIIFHVDGAQAVGKIPMDVEQMGIDLLSLSGHKIYGPKGVGALFLRSQNPRIKLDPILEGGGHERGLRPGTLNVPGIVGLGKACELALQEMPEESQRIRWLRDLLCQGLISELEGVRINGDFEKRLPHNINMSFAHVEGESLMMSLQHEAALSSGAACMSANIEPSYVLKALGVSEDLADTSIRFGLGRFTTEEEIRFVLKRVVEVVKELRAISPLYEMSKNTVRIKEQ